MKVRMPTVTTSKFRTPLYALERSTEEIAFVPPRAKKDMYCRRREDVVSSVRVSDCAERNLKTTSKSRNSGTLVARLCVMARSVYN